jgi:hypothetical protein
VVAFPDGWMPGTWARLAEPAGKVTVDLTTHVRWDRQGRLLTQTRQLVLLARRR